MDEDRKTKFEEIKKLIEEGKLKLPYDTPLFNALVSKEFHRSPTDWPDGKFVATDPAFEPPKPLFVKIHHGQMYINKTSDVDIDENVYKQLADSITMQQFDQLRFGTWNAPTEMPIVSTASDEASAPMSTELLLDMMKTLKNADPLLKNGVQQDWVCVIHPGLVSHIGDFYKEHQPTHFVPYNKLDYVLGRRVFIINEAPTDKIEYMPEMTMRMKYFNHFLRELEMRAKRKEKEEDDATD